MHLRLVRPLLTAAALFVCAHAAAAQSRPTPAQALLELRLQVGARAQQLLGLGGTRPAGRLLRGGGMGTNEKGRSDEQRPYGMQTHVLGVLS